MNYPKFGKYIVRQGGMSILFLFLENKTIGSFSIANGNAI